MLETYRGIPHLLDTWLVLTGMTLPIAISSLRRPGDLVPRLAAFCLPAAVALVLAATLSPTAHRLDQIGQCGTHLTTTGGLTSLQGLLNVLLFVPAAGMLTLASGRPADGIAAGIGMSAAVEAVQALIPQLGRSCQLHDLLANSIGAFCGGGCGRRPAEHHPQPSAGRRSVRRRALRDARRTIPAGGPASPRPVGPRPEICPEASQRVTSGGPDAMSCPNMY